MIKSEYIFLKIVGDLTDRDYNAGEFYVFQGV
jgi:hypothetical protein